MDVFAANDIAAFIPSGTGVTETTTGVDTTFTNKGVVVSTTNWARTGAWVNPSTGALVTFDEGWAHFESFNWTSGSAGNEIARFQKTDGTYGLRLMSINFYECQMQYWNGAAWVALGPIIPLGAGSVRTTFDIYWKITATTYEIVACANGLQFAAAVSPAVASTIRPIAAVQFHPGGYSNGHVVSQVLVSDQNTVGAKVANLALTGNGANTAWTGVYTDVWKVGNGADALLIGSSAAGQDETYVAADITLPPNMKVSSLWLAARVRAEAGANIKPLLRIGATNYEGVTFPNAVPGSFTPSLAAFLTDPSTGGAWSLANLNAAEIGVRSV